MLFQSRDFWLTVLKMTIKIGLFFFLTFFCIITPIPGIIDHYCIMESFKKDWGKIKTDQEQYTLKIMKVLITANLDFRFSNFRVIFSFMCAEADLGLLQHPRWSAL